MDPREYEEMYFYDKPSTTLSDDCGGIAGALFGAGIGVILAAFWTLVFRFDVLSSSLLGALFCAFSYSNGNGWKINLAIFIGTLAISIALQHLWIGFRIIYGIFACVAVALLATMIIGYDSTMRMWQILITAFIITAGWGLFSWKVLMKSE